MVQTMELREHKSESLVSIISKVLTEGHLLHISEKVRIRRKKKVTIQEFNDGKYAGIIRQRCESHQIETLQQKAINVLQINKEKAAAQNNEDTDKNETDCFYK